MLHLGQCLKEYFSPLPCNTHLLSNYYSISELCQAFVFFLLCNLVFCLFVFVFVSLFGHTTQHMERPRPGIEPMPPAVEARSLNHWATREVLCNLVYIDSQAAFRLINSFTCLFIQQTYLKSIRNPQIRLVERGNVH